MNVSFTLSVLWYVNSNTQLARSNLEYGLNTKIGYVSTLGPNSSAGNLFLCMNNSKTLQGKNDLAYGPYTKVVALKFWTKTINRKSAYVKKYVNRKSW